MDLQTFLFHAGLFAVAAVIGMIYSKQLEQQTVSNAENIVNLKESEKNTQSNISFAREIASGDFDSDYQLQSGDRLGEALVEMRDNLKNSAIREKQERFINTGIAEASDLIRNNSSNLDELSDRILSYLVNYLGANQGGIFLVDHDENEVELVLKGCYAYGRKKYLQKTIKPGSGLVGQCYVEKDEIYMTKVPSEYVRITSGLGEATPTSLLLVPIKNDDGIQGVIEVASFKELEPYKIDFMKRIAENLATAVNATKLNERTRALYEESQQQAEEMKAQEEEMRQNMEELQATQEEMHRKEKEYLQRIEELENIKNLQE